MIFFQVCCAWENTKPLSVVQGYEPKPSRSQVNMLLQHRKIIRLPSYELAGFMLDCSNEVVHVTLQIPLILSKALRLILCGLHIWCEYYNPLRLHSFFTI